jgi:multidrug efflux pump subunit AcrA (membrane-fusion protein)
MELLVTRYKPWIMIILLVLLVSFAIYRWWQGPLLPSYEVVSSPLIQTVVASGRVEKVSRTQIGSEITGVVLELGSRGRFILEGCLFSTEILMKFQRRCGRQKLN